jgi:hypothetical protein
VSEAISGCSTNASVVSEAISECSTNASLGSEPISVYSVDVIFVFCGWFQKENVMRSGARTSVFCLILVAGLSTPVLAKDRSGSKPENENLAIIVGEAGEQYPLFGSGGIKVSGGHHGMFMSNMKRSAIQIDGSDIAAKSMAPFNETADFNSAAGCAYFVSQTSTCTLPSAIGVAGQEVVVCNTGSGTKISYQTSAGESIFAGNEAAAYTNSTQGKVDRFLSDGKSWYRE